MRNLAKERIEAKLIGCPFCAAKPKFDTKYNSVSCRNCNFAIRLTWMHEYYVSAMVEAVIQKWNTRPLSTHPTQQAEEK